MMIYDSTQAGQALAALPHTQHIGRNQTSDAAVV